MANWKHECNISQFIGDKSLSLSEKIEKISEEISKCPAFDDTLFAQYLEETLDLDESDMELEANGFLKDIYDFADSKLIWIGP